MTGLTLREQEAIEEAAIQLEDCNAVARGDLECDPEEAIEQAREAVRAALAVLTKWRRRAAKQRRGYA